MTGDFGAWLRERMADKGWRQRDLAVAIGVSQQTASRWMLGRTTPTVRNAQSLAQALGVSTDEVIERLETAAQPSGTAPDARDEELAALRTRVQQLEAELRRQRHA